MTTPHPIDALEKRVAELERRLDILGRSVVRGFPVPPVDAMNRIGQAHGDAMAARWAAEDKAADEQAALERLRQ